MKIAKNRPLTWMNSRNSWFEPLEQLHVIGEIDEAGAQQRPHERHHRQQHDEPLLVKLPP